LDQVSGRGRSDDGASTHFAIASPIRGGCRHQRIHRRRLDHRLESSSDALGWGGLDSNVDGSIDWEQRVGNAHVALGTRMTRSSALPQRYQTRDTRPSGPRLPRRSGAAKWISLDTCRGRDTPCPRAGKQKGAPRDRPTRHRHRLSGHRPPVERRLGPTWANRPPELQPAALGRNPSGEVNGAATPACPGPMTPSSREQHAVVQGRHPGDGYAGWEPMPGRGAGAVRYGPSGVDGPA